MECPQQPSQLADAVTMNNRSATGWLQRDYDSLCEVISYFRTRVKKKISKFLHMGVITARILPIVSEWMNNNRLVT